MNKDPMSLIASYRAVLAVSAMAMMPIRPALAMDRLILMSGVLLDLKPVIDATCNDMENETDVTELERRRKTILSIQRNVAQEYIDRSKAYTEGLNRATQISSETTSMYEKLRNAHERLAAYRRGTPAPAESVLQGLQKTVQELETAIKGKLKELNSQDAKNAEEEQSVDEAKTATEEVDEKVSVVLRCIAYRKADLEDPGGATVRPLPPLHVPATSAATATPPPNGGPATLTLEAGGRTETVNLEWTDNKYGIAANFRQGIPERDPRAESFRTTPPTKISQSVEATVTLDKALPPPWVLWLGVAASKTDFPHCGPTTGGCNVKRGPYPRGPGWAASEEFEVWLCQGQTFCGNETDPVAAINIDWRLE